tara:strand:+ start:410 stop:1447 length:1038 start_codon:yes stop_codon:yes gene_type:complete
MADIIDPQTVEQGSIAEAQSAFLGILEPEEAKPETEASEPTEDVDESTEETQDEPLEEDALEEETEVEEESDEEQLDENEEEETEEVYSVKVDGEEMEVSLDELVNGYSRQSDYTRKTQELASQRDQMAQMQQQWATEISEAQAERQQYIEALGQFVHQSMAGLEQYATVNWEQLREDDPIAFVTKKEEFRDAQERVRQAQAQQEYEHQKQNEEIGKVRKMAVQEEYKRLTEAVPEWNDPEKRTKLASDLSSYAIQQGFTQQELKELIDHRSLIVLMKASKYDALQKSDVKAKKLKNKPKVVRSGKGGVKKADKDRSKRIASMKRLKESGHVNDSVSLFEDFVDI